MTDIENSGVILHKNDRDVDLEWERDMIIYADRLRPENRIGAEVVFAGLSSGGTWMKHKTKSLRQQTIPMLLALALPLANAPAAAAQGTNVDVDGVWGVSDLGTDGEGANCDRWATGPGGSASAISDTDPGIQNQATNDENQIRYGAQDVNDDPPPCLDFADQSGFGFEGVYGTNMPTDGASFKLGTFTHYNSVTNGDLADYNPLENVRLTITLSGSVDAALQYTITLVETVNDDDPCMFPDAPNDPPCGEKVTIASEPLQTSTIQIQRKQYTLEMVGFADCDVPGTPTNTFYTHEMAADRACLYARLIETTR